METPLRAGVPEWWLALRFVLQSRNVSADHPPIAFILEHNDRISGVEVFTAGDDINGASVKGRGSAWSQIRERQPDRAS